MVNTPPSVKAILDDNYPLPPPAVDNILDTPPQATLEERRRLRRLLKTRGMAKSRLRKKQELKKKHANMETNNDNYPVTPHQPTAAEEALATLRTMMGERQGNHADAAARVAREAASAAASSAMEGLALINQQELASFTPAINTLAETVARESVRRTGEKQRRRSEAEAMASPTANMTNPVKSPEMDMPKSVLKKSATEDTEEIDVTPRRSIFQRISSTFSSSEPKKRKARISFGGTNNVKEYTKDSPLKQEDDDDDSKHVVIYDRSIYNTWVLKTDEQFLEDFTLQIVDNAASRDGASIASITIKQILFVANAKHLLRDIPIQVLRAANRVAWPTEKKFFVNLSPVRRQIKSRLAKSYKIVQEYNMAKEKEAEEQAEVDAAEMEA